LRLLSSGAAAMRRPEEMPISLPADPTTMDIDFQVPPLPGGPASVSSEIVLPAAIALRQELSQAVADLSFCELAASAQWAAELSVALPPSPAVDGDMAARPADPCRGITSGKLYSSVMLAKTHFSMREYGRAAHALQGFKDLHKCPQALFLRLYALYLAGEKRREEETMEVADPAEKCQVRNAELKGIEELLAALHGQQALDGLGLYLYGITLRGLEMMEEARRILLKSVRAFPCNWSAWLDIIATCSDLNDITDLRRSCAEAPNHWMAWFAQAALDIECQRNEEAFTIYSALRRFFPDSSHILSQIAACQYNMIDFDLSQSSFEEVRKRDPYKLTSLDTYSNILYVKEDSASLSNLARQAVKIDKYTPEACCIIGNYYSLKGEHEKSVTYFQRALSLKRNFTPAWILMGHEYMEMKNVPAAIDAYRTAVNINQRDYRAWYGLGQTYELLNLHFYALFYYRRAMTLRPEDARMWCAMAECYNHMDRKFEAMKCYEKAYLCGDRERMALPRLARLQQELGDRRKAAYWYTMVVQSASPGPGPLRASGSGLSTEVIEALRFLMSFYREEGKREECELCANQLLDTAGPGKDEAKAMLRDLRSASDGRGGYPAFVGAPESSRASRR